MTSCGHCFGYDKTKNPDPAVTTREYLRVRRLGPELAFNVTTVSVASRQRGAATLGNPGDDQVQAAGRCSRDSDAPDSGFTRL
jgi:hypothetical protein